MSVPGVFRFINGLHDAEKKTEFIELYDACFKDIGHKRAPRRYIKLIDYAREVRNSLIVQELMQLAHLFYPSKVLVERLSFLKPSALSQGRKTIYNDGFLSPKQINLFLLACILVGYGLHYDYEFDFHNPQILFFKSKYYLVKEANTYIEMYMNYISDHAINDSDKFNTLPLCDRKETGIDSDAKRSRVRCDSADLDLNDTKDEQED